MPGFKRKRSLKPLDQLKNKKRSTQTLRHTLRSCGREKICEWCRCEHMSNYEGVWHWNGKPITLQIDHIHGRKVPDCDDAWNLRYLCPNCHAQTHNHTINTPLTSTDRRLTPCERLRRKLRNAYIEYKCALCKCKNMQKEHEKWLWNGREMKFEIDHIDGNRSNNDICNLRWLCSSCHTQTPTHSGRNMRKKSYVS